ncbi:MAG TPA: hypothetical protein VEY14_14245, partial [Nocardioidaceae bacterium]|nr:hypothetical protein [Nocardioidaceae bacterium]
MDDAGPAEPADRPVGRPFDPPDRAAPDRAPEPPDRDRADFEPPDPGGRRAEDPRDPPAEAVAAAMPDVAGSMKAR